MSSITTHFGLGPEIIITQLVVKWPSGVVDTLSNVSSNQTLLIVEGSSLAVNSFTNSDFTMYPNPVKKTINWTINSNTMELKFAQIYDLNGRRLMETVITNNSINVENIANGTYLIVVKDSQGKNYSQKFIKE